MIIKMEPELTRRCIRGDAYNCGLYAAKASADELVKLFYMWRHRPGFKDGLRDGGLL